MVVACENGVPTHPPASQLSPGLTVFDAKPDFGINAAYVKNGRVIYIETRIGPTTPEAIRLNDPTAPLHEVDVRFVDQYGATFTAQMGGDGFIEQTWAAEMAANAGRAYTAAERTEDFVMSREAANAINAQMNAAMIEHVEPLLANTRVLPHEDPRLQARVKNLPTTSEVGYTNYTHYADLYKKCLVGCLGEHAAAYAWDYNQSTGTYDWSLNTCNHGTCAGSMSYYCTSSSVHTYQAQSYFTGDTTTSTGSRNGACCTNYNWNPGSGQHNSNDDAFYEMQQIKNGSRGSCSSTSTYSDGCSATYSCASGNGNGEFSGPCCL